MSALIFTTRPRCRIHVRPNTSRIVHSHSSDRQKDPGVSPARETLFMALARYLRASQAYPSTVQLATGAFVMAVGDASTQLAVEGGQTLDPNRIGCAQSALCCIIGTSSSTASFRACQ